jgi:hypothetical protein
VELNYCKKERRGERKKGKRREKEGEKREGEERGKIEVVILITTNHLAVGVRTSNMRGMCS